MANQQTGGIYFDAENHKRRAPRTDVIPARLVYGMFGLAATVLVLTSAYVLSDRPLVGVPEEAAVVAERTLVVAGEGNGATVTTPEGEVVFSSDNGAFITVVRVGLERARLVRGVEGNPPVVLTRFENGRMQLSDPASGWSVQLSSFGQGNMAHFARLFDQ